MAGFFDDGTILTLGAVTALSALAVARRGSRAKRPISISEGFRVEAAFDAGYEACLGQPTQHDLEAQLDEASPGEVEAARRSRCAGVSRPPPAPQRSPEPTRRRRAGPSASSVVHETFRGRRACQSENATAAFGM